MTKTTKGVDSLDDAGASASLRELFVLGMVSRRPMYGHEIMRTLSISNARAWIEISDKHVYHVLRKLEQRGLVTGTEERDEGRPPRRRFELTTPGRAALEAMITNEAHQQAAAYCPFDTVIAMLAWGNADGELALELLHRRRRALADRLAREHPPAFSSTIEARFGRVPRAMFVKARVLLAAELRWLDALITEASRLGWEEMRIRDEAAGLDAPAATSTPRSRAPRAPRTRAAATSRRHVTRRKTKPPARR